MRFVSMKAVLVTVWVVAVCLAAIVDSLNAQSIWTVLVAIAVLPPIVSMWRGIERPQTLSEIIQEARR